MEFYSFCLFYPNYSLADESQFARDARKEQKISTPTERGDANVQLETGIFLSARTRVNQDWAKRYDWLRKSAAQGLHVQ